jgi:hypothetical protein
MSTVLQSGASRILSTESKNRVVDAVAPDAADIGLALSKRCVAALRIPVRYGCPRAPRVVSCQTWSRTRNENCGRRNDDRAHPRDPCCRISSIVRSCQMCLSTAAAQAYTTEPARQYLRLYQAQMRKWQKQNCPRIFFSRLNYYNNDLAQAE